MANLETMVDSSDERTNGPEQGDNPGTQENQSDAEGAEETLGDDGSDALILPVLTAPAAPINLGANNGGGTYAGDVQQVQIEVQMRTAYLDYAVSVIVGRAFPDARDGLKPVHRRVLYTMLEENIRANGPYKKSARTVGNVIAKYHPHGESSIYDALVRMAQPFSLRYPLVDGQGNFGSVDNDPAAAMRYTEARLTAVAEELLADIDKDTIDFNDNFDATEKEPSILPGKLPNLLLNGAEGIAVGMATKIPTHNLRELVAGITHLIDHPNAGVDELMQFVTGPDFPTAGYIIGRSGIREAYATGRGRINIRAKVEVEESDRGHLRLIVSELPYQVNKATLQEKIVELVKDKKLDGIADLRDESDRQGMRLVIELKRDARPDSVRNNLFKHTTLQTAFNVNMVAVIGQQPKLLTLVTALQCYIDYRIEVIGRRTRFDLRKARDRAHILEGLTRALDRLDEVIATIRAASSTEEARTNLITIFGLSEVQANAILDMQLRRLVLLERQRLLDELAVLRATITDLEDIIDTPTRVRQIIKDELAELGTKYGDARRTVIMPDEDGYLSEADLQPRQSVLVCLTERGYAKRMVPDTYVQQSRGGRGRRGIATKDDDGVRVLTLANTHDWLLVFTNRGRVLRTRVWALPEVLPNARGTSITNLVAIDASNGIGKQTPWANFRVQRRGGHGLRASVTNARTGPLVSAVSITPEATDLMAITASGIIIRTRIADIRRTGRNSSGVRIIRPDDGDTVVAASAFGQGDLDFVDFATPVVPDPEDSSVRILAPDEIEDDEPTEGATVDDEPETTPDA
ncbi:MAG: DNA topoisomerase 4 subunit A [Proteobacteria bacterium]|nr:DNA topoisomerase 4 subunit A [Pseudomonadota bacterium]